MIHYEGSKMFKRDQIKPVVRVQKRGMDYGFMKSLKKMGWTEVEWRGEAYLVPPK